MVAHATTTMQRAALWRCVITVRIETKMQPGELKHRGWNNLRYKAAGARRTVDVFIEYKVIFVQLLVPPCKKKRPNQKIRYIEGTGI